MMKLGTQTGSLVNHLYSRTGSPEPEVGMGVTILGWTDRYPGTIIAIQKGLLTVREDSAIRTDNNGMSEIQEYDYVENPDGHIRYFKKNRKGRWTQCFKNLSTGRMNFTDSSHSSLLIGRREKYHDYSF